MKFLFTVILLFSCFGLTNGQEVKEEYLYKLKVVPRLEEPEAWTDEDNKIVGEHFRNLQDMLEEGTLILAGRTTNEDSTMFGIVIFEATSREEAEKIMLSDPAVSKGIMTAELFPYRVALMRNQKQ